MTVAVALLYGEVEVLKMIVGAPQAPGVYRSVMMGVIAVLAAFLAALSLNNLWLEWLHRDRALQKKTF